MPTNHEYEILIRQYATPAALLTLWQQIQQGNTPQWEAGKAFEYLVLRAFEIEGAEVAYPFSVRGGNNEELEQIDGAIYGLGWAALVESKDQQERLNFEPIAKLYTQLTRRPSGTLGLVFSHSGYTPSAVSLTRMLTPMNLMLWYPLEIERALTQQQLLRIFRRKQRALVEQGNPSFIIQERL